MAGRTKQTLRRAARVAGSPLLDYVNRTIDRVEFNWNERMGRLEHRLLGDLEANAELTAQHARTLGLVLDKLERLPVEIASADARAAIGHPPADITVGIAEFTNWVSGHTGFAAQRHLWINQPLSIEHLAGDVRVGSVNERIVEIPYVLRALGTVGVPSRIFDFGSLESLLPLFLASLGHHVTALDLQPYPFRHPNIEAVSSLIQDWADPETPYDAVVSLSTVEHIGLGSYEQRDEDMSLDQQTIARFRGWLRPGGLLVLTAPFGEWRVDEFQRIYDDAHLDTLLDGYRILDRQYAVQNDGDHAHWSIAGEPPRRADRSAGTAGVVLITATPEE
jgi:hypothetical protein